MSTDRQMEAARATAARDAAQHGQPARPVGAISNWVRPRDMHVATPLRVANGAVQEIFKSAFHRDNPLHARARVMAIAARLRVLTSARALRFTSAAAQPPLGRCAVRGR